MGDQNPSGEQPDGMLVIGIAGGVASGKSLVTSCFQSLGAQVIDADRVGHEVLQQPEIVAAIVDRWGTEILDQSRVDRQRLAQIVFAPGPDGEQQLQFLEQLMHPEIGSKIQAQLRQLRSDRNVPAVVLDAPVMFKVGWDKFCDRIVFVDASLEVRLQRARKRGWPDGELERREARQWSVERKRSRSTDVIDNSNSKQSTFREIVGLWQQWGLPLPDSLEPPAALFAN